MGNTCCNNEGREEEVVTTIDNRIVVGHPTSHKPSSQANRYNIESKYVGEAANRTTGEKRDTISSEMMSEVEIGEMDLHPNRWLGVIEDSSIMGSVRLYGYVKVGKPTDGRIPYYKCEREEEGKRVRYVGQMYRDMKMGKGSEFDGEVLKVGKYVDDRMEGEGGEFRSDGSVFRGVYREGKIEEGEMREGTGDVYNGKYGKEGKIEGYGVHKKKNGEKYRGAFVGGVYEGTGTMEYTDGSYYIGEWKNGVQHGKGRLISAGGATEELEYHEGRKLIKKVN